MLHKNFFQKLIIQVKKQFFMFIMFLSVITSAQESEASQFFDLALKHFNTENYRVADSLYTLSMHLEPGMEVYYNRAICRGKLSNKLGYCHDLAQASVLGETRATRYYARACGKIDTVLTKVDQNYTSTTILSKVLSYHYKDSILLVYKQKYAGQESHLEDSIADEKIHRIVETNAEFPGGVNAMMKFINKHKKIPPSLKSDEKVYLRFTIFEDGSLQNIVILKNSQSCAECDEEAMRLVAIMPAWVPATMDGKIVKCYFNLPISFKMR